MNDRYSAVGLIDHPNPPLKRGSFCQAVGNEKRFRVHASGNLPLTCLDSYERKSRKVDAEPRIEKKLIPKFIFRRSEAQKNPLFFQ